MYTSLPPSSSPRDCLHLRFSMFADIAHFTNYYYYYYYYYYYNYYYYYYYYYYASVLG